MTPEAIRTRIAEACGWKPETTGPEWWQSDRIMPNYPEDLNAIHEVIMSQPQTVRDSINHTLMDMLRPNDKWILDRTINATAAQRCEAFLKTLGLWEDAP